MHSDQAYLILTQHGEQKHVYAFTWQTIVTIGRATENTISLLDDRCSRFHTKLFCNDGQWYIQDLGSRNGTFLDDLNVGTGACPIQSGQHIQIGRAFMQFGLGSPEEVDTKISGLDEDGNVIKHHSGILGVSEDLRGPNDDADSDSGTEIIHQKSRTALLLPSSEFEVHSAALPATKTGFGPAEMCRLAYQIGKAEDIDHVAKIALEGLLEATHAEGAGLWLFPYMLHSQQQASDIRLVSETTLNQVPYAPISAALARTVFEKQEAFLVHENPNEGTKKNEKNPPASSRREFWCK
jgi:hypothetical protein